MTSPVHGAGERQVRAADAVVLFWCVLWLVVGVGVGVGVGVAGQVLELARLGNSLSRAGAALDTLGQALQELRDLPLVGDTFGKLGDEVRRTTADLLTPGQQSQAAGRRLGVLLGLTTTAAPTAPVVLVYLPLRLHRRRQRRQLLSQLAGPDPGLDALRAHRALVSVPHSDLRQVVADPVAAFHAGQDGPLAGVELRRLGLQRSTI